MSSNDKRDLTTKANDGVVFSCSLSQYDNQTDCESNGGTWAATGKGKGGGVEVTGDVVTLPPDADDVIFTSVCDSSLSGVVDAKLEMSYDKENWCPAVTEEYAAGTSVTGWGNSRYLDTVPGTGVKKNKYCQGKKTYDTSGNPGGSARDVLYDFMQKNKPFNINWWHKSETVPNIVVTTPAVLGVEKAIHTKNSAGYGTTAVEPCGANQLTPTLPWSISYWIRADASANAYHAHLTDTSLLIRMGVHGGTKFKLNLGSHGLNYNLSGHPTIFANDTDWHHIVVTCDGNSNAVDDYTHGTVDSNHKVYIDGVFIDRVESSLTSDYTNTNAFKVNSNSFSGSWTDISFWNVDLSSDKNSTTGASQKIQDLYNSGVPTNLTGESGLVTWYRCGDNASDSTSTIVNNATSYSNDGMTLTGFDNTANGEIVDIGSGESVYQAFVPEVTANNYNPIIFRQGNKDPFSNEKYLNLSKGTGEYKNKYLSAPANITSDTFTKCLEVSDSTDTGAFLEIENTCGSGSSDFHDGKLNPATASTKSWTMSFWYKSPSNSVPNSTSVSRFMAYFGRSWGLYLGTDGKFYLDNLYVSPEIVMPTGINLFDGNWHHVTFTWRHDSGGSTTASNYKFAANNATDPGSSLFIDGQPCTTALAGWTAYHTLPPFMASDMGIAGYNPGVSSALGSVPGRYAHLAIETGAQVAADASARYNTGVPTDLSSTVPIYLNFENDSNDSGTSSISSSTNLDEQGTGHSSSGTPDSDYPSVVHGSIFSIATLSNTNMKAQINRDIFDSKMGADKPFTINTWFNSSNAPVTTNATNFDVTKYVYTKMKDSYNTAGKDRAIYVQNPWTYSDWASSTNWSISMWLKYEGDDPSGTFCTIQHGTRGIQIGKNNSSIYLSHNLPGNDPEVTIPATLNDGDWHNVTITHSNSDTYDTMGTDPSTCNTLVYLNGALVTPSSGGTVTSTTTYGNNSSVPVYLNLGCDRNGSVNASSTFLHVSTWTKTLSSTEVNSILGANDKPKDLAGQSNLACWLPLGDGYDTSNSSTVDTVVGSSAKFWDMSGNGRHALPHQASNAGGNVAPSNADVGWDQTDSPVEGVTNLGTSENVYIAPSTTSTDNYLPVLFNNGGTDGSNFGNGLTASFTKKVNTSNNTFDASAGQATSLLLSLDGFEDGADAWVNYPAASLLDGNWHNLQITWDGSGDGSTSKTYDTNLKVFVDGTQLTKNASKGGSSTFTAADKHFKYTTGTFVPVTFGASGWAEEANKDYESSAPNHNPNGIYAFQGALDNLSLHSEVTTLAKAQEFYSKNGNYEGKPHNYQMSNTLTYSNVEGWWTFDETGDSITVANDRTSNNIDLTLNNFVSGGNGLVTMSNSDSIYLVNPLKGEGFTVSMTKNLKDDGTWVDSQDQTARLILSFNGFERDAEHWVAYNTTQTIGSSTINLLDGRWHSVTLSYQGTTAHAGTALSENEIRYGKTQVGGVDQPFHFVVSYDGQSLEDIVGAGSVSGYNLSKDGETGFVIQNKHLRHENSAAEYVPTTYLASGFIETNTADSIYAFQGGFDESSFHSDNWWISTTNYNQEKPYTIYGITFGVAAEYQNRKKPYNLRQPSSAGVTTTTQDQYINPNPYDASTNPGGGMEVYYRWGDTLNDCSTSVKDVRGHEGNPKVLDRDINAFFMVHTDTESLATSDSGSGTLYSRDITANGITMYAAPASETTEGGLQSNIVQISGCAPNSIKQHIIKGPKLAHMRVKWSGAGSCDLGEDKCRAKLWFRRRKK